MSNASDNTLEFQCPKCARRLKASAKAAGKRSKCPSCGQAVKVPGASASQSTDDDWLNLESAAVAPEEPPPPRVAAARTDSPPTASGSTSGNSKQPISGNTPLPSSSSSGAASGQAGEAGERTKSTSIFDDDLPELAELEPPRPRVELGGVLSLEDLEGLVPPVVPPSPPRTPAAGKPVAGKPTSGVADTDKANAAKGEATRRAQLIELAKQQYRVPCPACGTPQYVTVADKGKTVKCPDCFLDFKVPPPPPGWKPSSKPTTTTWSTDLVVQTKEEAERDAAQSRSRADEYLRNAEQELNDADIDNLYGGDFDTPTFMRRTFGFFYDPTALAQAVAHSVVFAIGFAAIVFCMQKVREGDMGYALIGGLGIPLIFLMTAFPLFAAAMTMLESVANGERRVREWPGFSFFDHIGELLVFGIALGAATIPGFLLGGLIGRSGGVAWMVIFSTLFTTFLLFPIHLLSILDNDHLFGFVSADVIRSLSKAYESWAVYYFKTFIAFSIVFITWAIMLPSGNLILAAIGGSILPWLVFFTSQQLGVLAGDISEHLSIVLDRDAKNEEETPEA